MWFRAGLHKWAVQTLQILLSFSIVAAATVLLMLSLGTIVPVTAALLYIFIILIVSIQLGLISGLAAAFAASLAFGYFFVAPYRSFNLTSLESTLRLCIFLVVATLVGSLSAQARRQATTARKQAAELRMLYELSRALSAEVELDRILRIAGETIERMLQVEACWIITAPCESLTPEPWVEDIEIPGTPHSLGCIRVRRRAYSPAFTADEHTRLASIASQLSLVMTRVHLTELAGRAQIFAESDRLKSTLLSLVSHDLRTPLAAIKGAASSLLSDDIVWSVGQQRELLHTIDEESDRLNRIVSDLLEMSRIEAGALSRVYHPHALDELIMLVVDSFQAVHPEREWRITVPEKPIWVQISYPQIEQTLRNLLENALHYTPEKTPVDIRVDTHEAVVQVTVADRGPGIPVSMHQRIFDRFVRAVSTENEPRGSGLGLAICKGLVEAHGGAIWVADRPGGGAIFAFTLPLSTRNIEYGSEEVE